MSNSVLSIGSVGFDIFHVALFALVLLTALTVVWLLPYRNRSARAAEQLLKAQDDFARHMHHQNELERELASAKARQETMAESLHREREEQSKRMETLDSEKRTLSLRLEESNRELDTLKVRESERARAMEEERRQLRELRKEVEDRFTEIAQAALKQSQSLFLETANETFGKQKEAAEGNLKALVSPIREAIGKFETRVEGMEKVRAEDKSAIFEQVKNIGELLNRNQDITSKLVNALSSPRGGGSWGEESLRNALELAGVSHHCDFLEQAHDTHSGLRPDVVLKMPGGREIVIDSKAVMDNYLRASEETDETRRKQYLAAHARHFKEQIKRLASKDYWKDIEHRVDFVAMWVPGENFYSAALSMDRDLFDFAARNRVLIVTPATLIALAKAVSYGWRQEEASKNALEAAKIGRELHKRLRTLSDHFERVGKHLNLSVSSYNKMMGSYDRMVLPQARRFEELQLNESGTILPDVPMLDEFPVNSKPDTLALPDDDEKDDVKSAAAE